MRSLLILLGIALFLLVFKLGSLSYLESSEARYAEISREMLVSGDYVTPTLIDIKHFHKPPLTYWMTALSFKIFGINNWSGRIFPLLCSLGILVCTFLISKMLFPQNLNIQLWSVGILLSSLLFLVQSRAVTTDIYLSFLTLAAIYFQWERKLFNGSGKLIIPTIIFLALAFLTKGPVPFIFYFIPYFIYVLIFRKWKKINISEIIISLVLFLVIVMPWFWLVIHKNPQLLQYFMVNQTVERYASTVHHRSGPPIYYVGVLFAGMMFWFTYYLPLLVKTLRNWRSAFDQHREVLLVIYSFIPLVFFSFSGSKLPSYIVPALPFFAILLAYWIFEKYKNQAFRVIQIINVSIGLIIPVLLIVKPFKNVPAGIDHYNFLFWGLGFLPIGFSAVYWYRLKRNKIRFEWLYGIYNVVFFMILVTVLPSVQSDLNSFEDMAKVINQKFTTGERIAAYKIRLPSLYFYTGQRVIHIMHDREIQFEDEDSKNELEQYLSDDPDKLAELISGEIGTYVAVRKKDWRNYLTEHLKLGATVDTLYQNQKFLLLKNHRSGT